MYVRPVRIAFLHGFAPEKCYSYSAYINVGARGIAFAAEQAPGISPQPAHARSGKLECDQSFFLRQNGSDQASTEMRRPERASKNHFQTSRGSWASEALQEVVQLPHSRRPASLQPARRAAALRRRQRQLQQGLAPLRAADGHGVHGPQPLHVAVLRLEAPRRVRRRAEGARVLHRLHAPVGKVLVVLELVGVVLEDCRPRPPARSGRSTPALARHPCGQVLLQRLDAPVHHGDGVAVLGPLRAVHGIFGQLPVQRGELVAQVRRDHEVPPRKLYRLARQRDLDVTQAMVFEALKADVGRQVQAPRPRALRKSAAKGRTTGCRPTSSTSARTRGGRRSTAWW